MLENVKNHAERQMYEAKNYCNTREDVLRCCSDALAVIMFAQTYLDVKYEELDWWDAMRDEFYRVANEKGR